MTRADWEHVASLLPVGTIATLRAEGYTIVRGEDDRQRAASQRLLGIAREALASAAAALDAAMGADPRHE